MKPGRNDRCPCGSGKKYKACCQASPTPAARSSALDAQELLALFHAGRHAELERQLQQLIRQQATNAFLWSLLGATLQMQGKDGLTALQQATTFAPNDSEAHGNLGTAWHQQGRLVEAENSYRRALAIQPQNLRAQLNLASLLINEARLGEAESCYRQALCAEPRLTDALIGLGNTLALSGRGHEAEDSFRQALQFDPASAEAYYCLGNVQRQGGDFAAAKASYSAAISAAPGFAPAYNNLACLRLDEGRQASAVDLLHQALRVDPNYAEAHANLALASVEMNQFAAAEAAYRRALQLTPGRADLHGRLAFVLKELGRFAEAEAAYRRQLELDPASAEARLALAILHLPMVPQDSAAAGRAAPDFAAALAALSAWLASDQRHAPELAKVIGRQQPFLLAYRDGNHVDLLAHFGDLAAGAVEATALAGHPQRDRVRLLIVANQVRRHSVWDIVLRGLMANLDRARFEIIVYHTGTHEDDETRAARTMVDGWRDRTSCPDVESLLKSIRADHPDVILYPEIGMDPFSFRLASHRLARLQLASWGHPISSGLPTIDLFLSGQLLEPPDADAHYRERLIRLPGTGCCTTPLTIAAEPLGDIEKRLQTRPGPRFVIAQRAFKFAPDDDAIYAEIAARLGQCSFILFTDPLYPWASQALYGRLEKAFRQRGLDPALFLCEIQWLAAGQFFSLLDAADVFLDCPAFSGYTTAWQALHRGLPMVTREGPSLRQRLAAGLLRKVGRAEMIAHSTAEYVDLAVSLARECADAGRRDALRQSIRDCASAADGDSEVVRAFERVVLAELEQPGVTRPVRP